MNDELKITDEQLRLATSRSLPTGTALDSETAAAREAFLSLGATVESATGTFGEAAFVARLKKSCLDATVVTPRAAEPARKWLALLLTGALAAAALIAIARIADDSRSKPKQHVAAITGDERTTIVPSIGMSPSRSIIAWNDSLDDEIALAAATLEQFAGRRQGFDDSLLNMNDQLQSLSQELVGESL